jgi:hypothetical protein
MDSSSVSSTESSDLYEKSGKPETDKRQLFLESHLIPRDNAAFVVEHVNDNAQPPRYSRCNCITTSACIGTFFMVTATILLLISLWVTPSNNEYKTAQCFIKDVNWVNGDKEFVGTVYSNVLAIKNINYVNDNTTYSSNKKCDKFDPNECLKSNKTMSCEVKYINNKIQKVSIAKFERADSYKSISILAIILYALAIVLYFPVWIASCINNYKY